MVDVHTHRDQLLRDAVRSDRDRVEQGGITAGVLRIRIQPCGQYLVEQGRVCTGSCKVQCCLTLLRLLAQVSAFLQHGTHDRQTAMGDGVEQHRRTGDLVYHRVDIGIANRPCDQLSMLVTDRVIQRRVSTIVRLCDIGTIIDRIQRDALLEIVRSDTDDTLTALDTSIDIGAPGQ